MSDQLISPVQLDFDCDWNRINSIYNQLIEQLKQNKFNSRPQDEYPDASVYSLGILGGSIIASEDITSTAWYVWNGEFLEKNLPPKFLEVKQQIIEAGLRFVGFTYTKHYGPIKEHQDALPDHSVTGQCNINFIISSSDPDSVTLATDGKNIESYPGIPGTCWLLDTGSLHEVKNSGYREVFQIRIHSSFSEVKDFFKKQGLVN
jgi:hypothetical protein